jgi:phosphoribosylformylglycinamidine (FGAM) synthase-like enzyme
MSPREIWCNEAQERYVIAIRAADLALPGALRARARRSPVVGRDRRSPRYHRSTSDHARR